MIEKCCGTCKYHKPSGLTPTWWDKLDYFCINEDTNAYGLVTDYTFCCEEWEER